MQFLPTWLAIIVVTRDVLIVGAVLLAWVLARPVEMRPLQVSKVNTVAQILFAGALLFTLATQLPLDGLLDVGEMMVAMLTLASGAIYMRKWVRHMSMPAGGKTP